MTHPDEELLAQWALEGTDPDPDAADHLATCASCQAALSDLRALTSELHATPELSTPSGEVWSRISADLDLTPGLDGVPTGTTTSAGSGTLTGTADTVSGATPGTAGAGAVPGTGAEPVAGTGAEPVAGARRGRRYGRGMLALAAGVAAILGIGIGLGAASVLDRDEQSPAPPPVAVVRLEPLPGKAGGGTADLIQAGNELQVSVDGLDARSGYYELWLINSDGERMVSLGVLDPATGGTFRIPDNLTSEGYRIVDVSLEPNDGNPAHSRDSVVRGTLPG